MWQDDEVMPRVYLAGQDVEKAAEEVVVTAHLSVSVVQRAQRPLCTARMQNRYNRFGRM